MKINLFGYEIELRKKSETLNEKGASAKKKKSWSSITKALDEIENRGIKYSEYRVQQISGVSINTIKKYRPEIERYRKQISRSLI